MNTLSVKNPYRLTPPVMPRLVNAMALPVDFEVPVPFTSDQEVAAEEWETFQDTLLIHVRNHQPGKCDGLLSQRGCETCFVLYNDNMRGKRLKQKMDAWQYLAEPAPSTATYNFDGLVTSNTYDERNDMYLQATIQERNRKLRNVAGP